MRFSALFTLGLAAVATAVPSGAPHVVHEKRHKTSSLWTRGSRAQPAERMSMRIGLKQRNLERGHDLLMDVSNPKSRNYGKHWSPEKVIETFSPSDATVEAVKQWLIAAGIAPHRITHSDNKAWLAFDATAAEAESLLKTEYHTYKHQNGYKTKACEKYHVPKQIQEHIDFVRPGIGLSSPKRFDGPGKHTLRRRETTPLELPSKMKRSYGPTIAPKKRGAMNLIPDARPTLGNISGLKTCDILITPECIRALYGLPPPNSSVAVAGNSLGIFEEGDFYDQEDLNLIFAALAPYVPQGTAPIANFIDGAMAPVNVTEGGGESILDFGLAFPIVYPTPVYLYQTDDINVAEGLVPNETTDGGFNTFLDAIDGSYCTYCAFGECGDDPVLDPTYPDPFPNGYKGQLQCGVYEPAAVISVSYGGPEDEIPAYYQERQCNEFLKLGLQGSSIFFSSGDNGVGQRPFNDNNGCLGNGSIFDPQWPVSCPYVTAVGATKVYPGHTVFEPESVANDLPGAPYSTAYSSGGGFSNIFGQPDYQLTAVNTYFAEHDPGYAYYSGFGNTSIGVGGGRYNRIGRAYPDVSANGDNIALFVNGNFTFEGGTSASSPIFASVVTRLNAERLLANKTTIGFINPALYANPTVLNDITNGTNPNCDSNGFPAVTGWDPSSGLGTPNYPKMLAYFLSLP
ncbi:hypothetical protein MMC25_005543 [Agyrium rufum]|nr:hypothetical protein [Agyrium rufum]